ncbi:cingulin-like protein 1 [Archocentrus centrarchus]|uniref:cingulin-like protein 1 n=1 Tax=Archocentrus centrarchus TaxID=63155 RepID=UPI0011E9D56B|nr:cingulin-like protein 1 [Archocentrus centrarchus]
MDSKKLKKDKNGAFIKAYLSDADKALESLWNEKLKDGLNINQFILENFTDLVEKYELYNPYPSIAELISVLAEHYKPAILGSELQQRLETEVVELKRTLKETKKQNIQYLNDLIDVAKQRDILTEREFHYKDTIKNLQRECRKLKLQATKRAQEPQVMMQELQRQVKRLKEENEVLEKRTNKRVRKLDQKNLALRRENEKHVILENELKQAIEKEKMQRTSKLVPLERKEENPKLQRIISEQRIEMAMLKERMIVLKKTAADHKTENEKLAQKVNKIEKLYLDENEKNKDLTAALKRKRESEQLKKSQLVSKMKSAHTTPVHKLNQPTLEVKGVPLLPISNKFQKPSIVPRVTKNEDKSASGSVPKPNQLKLGPIYKPLPSISKKSCSPEQGKKVLD